MYVREKKLVDALTNEKRIVLNGEPSTEYGTVEYFLNPRTLVLVIQRKNPMIQSESEDVMLLKLAPAYAVSLNIFTSGIYKCQFEGKHATVTYVKTWSHVQYVRIAPLVRWINDAVRPTSVLSLQYLKETNMLEEVNRQQVDAVVESGGDVNASAGYFNINSMAVIDQPGQTTRVFLSCAFVL